MKDNYLDNIDFISEEDDDEGFSDESQNQNKKFEHHRFVADKGQGPLRVDKFLSDRIEGISRNRIQQAAESKSVFVNGISVKSNYKIKPLDIVTIELDWPRRELEITPENIPLEIVYEDDALMVVNKPAGMVVHPGHGNYTGTLVNAVAYHLNYKKLEGISDPRLGLVHRIDKDTSGLLLIAKTPEAKTNLSGQFFRKETKRLYTALVWGNVLEDNGTIEGNIGRDPKNRMLFRVFPDNDQGKNAITHYKVIERFGYVTLVECQLETGRTHQIRVHMKEIGHTLFNDERYGGNEILRGTHFAKYKQFIYNCFDICPRQCLHAQSLGFVHPTTKEELYFKSDIPDDILSIIDKWRSYTASRDF